MSTQPLLTRMVRPVGLGLRSLLWLAFAATTGLVIVNSLPYYTFAEDLPFFLEKAAVYQDVLWRGAFYVHVTGGVLCLVAALPQFSKAFLRRAPRVHRALGWTYVVSVLVLVVPAGLYMAIFAKGGMPGRFGFILLGVTLFYATWRGLEHVRARDFKGHVPWMVRSYAMATSALTFRVFYLGLYAAGVDSEYVLAIWLSFFVNLVAAELLIRRPWKGLLS